jgi:hypothetical protein
MRTLKPSEYLRLWRDHQNRHRPGWQAQWRALLDREDGWWQVATVQVIGRSKPYDLVVLCRGGFEGERIEGFDPDPDEPPPAADLRLSA